MGWGCSSSVLEQKQTSKQRNYYFKCSWYLFPYYLLYCIQFLSSTIPFLDRILLLIVICSLGWLKKVSLFFSSLFLRWWFGSTSSWWESLSGAFQQWDSGCLKDIDKLEYINWAKWWKVWKEVKDLECWEDKWGTHAHKKSFIWKQSLQLFYLTHLMDKRILVYFTWLQIEEGPVGTIEKVANFSFTLK